LFAAVTPADALLAVAKAVEASFAAVEAVVCALFSKAFRASIAACTVVALIWVTVSL
jgi:hypothetical protein